MAKENSARKRRRVDDADTVIAAGNNDNAPIFDDEAMKQHMLSLLQHKRKQGSETADGSDESSGTDGSDSGQDNESEVDEDAGAANDADDSDLSGHEVRERASLSRHHSEGSDSDEEDLDRAARALLSNSRTPSDEQRRTQESTSRISRIPADRTYKSAVRAPVLKTTFEGLGLSVNLIRTLAGISIRKPTEIQSACFEPILSG